MIERREAEQRLIERQASDRRGAFGAAELQIEPFAHHDCRSPP